MSFTWEISEDSSQKQNQQAAWRERKSCVLRNWLMWLRRLSSNICGWQAGDPGEPMLQFQSETKGLRTGRTSGMVPSNARKFETQEESVFQFESEGWRRPVFQLSNHASGAPCYSTSLFCSDFQLSGWTRSHCRRQSASLSPMIQMLTSCRNTLIDTPTPK